jgi:predicted GNAT superfamily acetyltransferase
MGTDPWELAHDAAAKAGVGLRPLTTLDDGDAILDVMIATWGEHQLIPKEMLRALAHSGNVPYGAFEGERMVGYVLGWLGVDPEDGMLHVHSHMLAVRPDARHGGIGYALKLVQRAQALEQDVHMARWTFDPLIARNAYFNLHKLGAVADRFERDFYGAMTDLLNRGERTDRAVIRWDLDREPGPRVVTTSDARVAVPEDHVALRAEDATEARRWRDRVADALGASLEAGAVAAAFDRERSEYVLVPASDLPA